jgi:spore maturation protein A
MLNIIWLLMMVIAVVVALFTGKIPAVILSVTDSAKFAFTVGMGLAGIMTLWLGLNLCSADYSLMYPLTILLWGPCR